MNKSFTKSSFFLAGFLCCLFISSTSAIDEINEPVVPPLQVFKISRTYDTVLKFDRPIKEFRVNVDIFDAVPGADGILSMRAFKEGNATLVVWFKKTDNEDDSSSFACIYTVIAAQDAPQNYFVPTPLEQALENVVYANSSVFRSKGENNVAVATSAFDPTKDQLYTCFFIKKDGITLGITNIIHWGENIFFQVVVANRTTASLKLSQVTFEYVTELQKWVFFKAFQKEKINPILSPGPIEIGPKQIKYFEFAIPSYATNGGVDIFLQEGKSGNRQYKINIPSEVLLQAPRK